jgi:hypothetical protein
MPESPNFEQIARTFAESALSWESGINTTDVQDLAEQLRLVWNTRGLADQHALDERLATLTGWITSEPYRNHLHAAIAAVDIPQKV